MAWSYRSDLADETYHAPGVALVEGETLPATPSSEQHAQEMMDPKAEEKRLKEEEKFREEAAKTANNAPHQAMLDRERERIRHEETAKVDQEELDKERDKIRKEEADRAKKAKSEADKEAKKENEHKAPVSGHK
jgi:hypothetical protein